MSLAVLAKTLRDYRVLLWAILAGTLLFELFLAWAVAETSVVLDKVRPVLELPLVRGFMRLALGADLLDDLSPTALLTFGLGHPMLYILAWTLLLTIASGALAGEVGRGTADLLLALPVSRTAVYVSTSIVLAVGCVAVGAAAVAALCLGERLFPMWEPALHGRLALVSVNFVALSLSIAGFSMFVSAVVSRRGMVVAVVLTVLLASDVVNLLSQFWERAQPISFLGFLHYYRPLPIIRTGELPYGDLGVLLGLALVLWMLGLWHFRRRDIPAV